MPYFFTSKDVEERSVESDARQEALLKEVATQFAMDSGPAGRQLSGVERYDRALDAVAQKHKIDKTALKREIEAYVDWVRAATSAATDYQRALAEFAEKHFERAAELAESAAVSYRQSLNEKTEEILIAKEKLYDSLVLAGNSQLAEYQFGDAIRNCTEALHLFDEVDDPEGWAVAAMMLAGAMRAAGQYEAALPLVTKAVEIQERVLGRAHPDTLTSVNYLGLLYVDVGDYEKALPFCQRAVEACQRVLGEDHPYTLSSGNNLGLLFTRMGEYDKALPLYEWVLEASARVLGEDHPETLIFVNNLGSLHLKMGEYDKALPPMALPCVTLLS